MRSTMNVPTLVQQYPRLWQIAKELWPDEIRPGFTALNVAGVGFSKWCPFAIHWNADYDVEYIHAVVAGINIQVVVRVFNLSGGN